MDLFCAKLYFFRKPVAMGKMDFSNPKCPCILRLLGQLDRGLFTGRMLETSNGLFSYRFRWKDEQVTLHSAHKG